MKSRVVKPFVVAWNNRDIKLSDGSTQREFHDHDKAIAFLEEEMSKVQFEKFTPEARAEYRRKFGADPAQCQLQCSREMSRDILLYGVSYVYITPRSVVKDVDYELNS